MKNTAEKSRSIFIAEDDPIMQELLREWFMQADPPVKVIMVDNGAKAVHFLKHCPGEERPDAILLDYNMPLLTGEEVLEKIHGDERYAGIPKIILSTWVHSVRIQRCITLGMAKFLTKPASVAEFNTLVKEVLGLI